MEKVSTSIRLLRRNAKEIAIDLGYSKETVALLGKAKTQREIDSILSKARHNAIKEKKGWY